MQNRPVDVFVGEVLAKFLEAVRGRLSSIQLLASGPRDLEIRLLSYRVALQESRIEKPTQTIDLQERNL